MPTLISEEDVKLERGDMLRRVCLPRDVTPGGHIIPPSRSPGLHLSGLIKYVAETSKITSRLSDIASEEMPLHWALGQAWEEFAASLYPDMAWQPGERLEPVIMTCDGLSLMDPCTDLFGLVVEEFKCNRSKKYKAVDLIQKKWLWMQQGLGYCLGYDCEYVRWHVLSVLEWPFPVYTKYLIQFSQNEIAGMSRMIEVNKKDAVANGYSE